MANVFRTAGAESAAQAVSLSPVAEMVKLLKCPAKASVARWHGTLRGGPPPWPIPPQRIGLGGADAAGLSVVHGEIEKIEKLQVAANQPLSVVKCSPDLASIGRSSSKHLIND